MKQDPKAIIFSKTLTELLQKRADAHGEKVLYTFLLDGEDEEITLTYRELDQKARILATTLQNLQMQGERALLLYPPSLDYIIAFFGCLYAKVIAVPAYPPDPSRLSRTLPRLLSIIRDSEAKIVLTTQSIKSMAEFLFQEAPELRELEWIATDELLPENGADYKEMPIASQDLAFLQYTSGSTGHPKGVMVSHGNLLHNLELIRVSCGFGEHSRGVSWLPPYHDMGLIAGIIEPLYANYPMTLFSPLDFLQKPLRWLQAISKYKATMTGGPNFSYELCAKKATPEFIKTLDLSAWDLASSGAEPIRAETIKRFCETFEPCGFRPETFFPSYGLAEATLIVSGCRETRPLKVDKKVLAQNQIKEATEAFDSVELVTCGKPLPDQKILIVHPESLQVLSDHEVGEIWVSGKSVAQGYWKKSEETQKVFHAKTKEGQGPFLRTGDLGFLKAGQLYVTGRIKDLIIIRGSNYYPQDIELSIEKNELPLRLGCGAVFSVEVEGEESLVLSWEVDSEKFSETSPESVFQKIRQVISENYEIQLHAIVLVKKGSIPKTSSGKIQRHAAKESFLEKSFEVIAEWKEAPQTSSRASNFSKNINVKKENYTRIQTWLVEKLAEKISVSPDEIDLSKPFTYYGLDSKDAVGISGELEAWLGLSFSPTLLWQYPNVESLAQYLSDELSGEEKNLISQKSATFHEPIAIIGMACRFPGANSPENFWELLKNGVDAITEVPPNRWNADKYYDPQGNLPGKMNTRWGGFLEKMDEFDARFFGISPREAKRMDPQQRILLEVTWEAFENANIPLNHLAGSQTGVFVGIGSNDYQHLQFSSSAPMDAYMGTGNAHCIAANRISYLFDFKGPSMALDTACSSSLVALHLACQSLRVGETNLALAGAVNLILKPETTIVFSKARMMSPKGRCFTFDAEADGYVRSEGCGVVILKRYSEALRDGDNILALIRGSAVNQDGHSNGLTAPNGKAQEKVILDALHDANVGPSELSFIEAHGTGTPLGDPIEVESISNVLKQGRAVEDKCWIGSAKTNVGHLEVSSGMVGLLKLVLSLKHRQIPSHLHFKKINPHIQIDQMPLQIPVELTEWKSEGKARIGAVNSFGFGGTNANLILQEAPEFKSVAAPKSESLPLLKFSAKSEKSLRQIAKKYSDFLSSEDTVSLRNFVYSANGGRTDLEYRAFTPFDSKDLLCSALENFSKGQKSSVVEKRFSQNRKPKIAFLFTGQGSQYPGMLKKLYESQAIVKKILDHCQEILKPLLAEPLLEVIFAEDSEKALIHETAYTQPALFSIEYALAELWRSWGVEADCVMGHSVGEYVAACYAGVMSWEDGLKLIAQRARLMQSLPKNGLMAVVAAPEAIVRAAIVPFAQEISVAGVNGPKNTVISGKRERVEAFVKYFSAQGIATQILSVSHAFHSPLMDPLLEEFEKLASEILYQTPRVKLISNLSGSFFEKDQKPSAQYYRDHLRGAVRFSQGIETLIQEGCDIFLELGPQAHLVGMGKKCAGNNQVTWLGSLKKGQEEAQSLREALGNLYLNGVSPQWENFYTESKPRKISIPTYPFERERFWIDETSSSQKQNLEEVLHPLLGVKIESPLNISQFVQNLHLEALPYLTDHNISGEIIFPGAAYVELCLAAVKNVYGAVPVKIKSLQLKEALFLSKENALEMACVLNPETKNEATFQVLSKTSQGVEQAWKEHAKANLEIISQEIPEEKILISQLQKPDMESFDKSAFYEKLHSQGLQYGPAFQALHNIWVNEEEAIAQIHLHEEVAGSSKDYQVHPSVLDAGFQLVAALISKKSEITKTIYLPSAISELVFHEKCGSDLWVRVRWANKPLSSSKKLKANLEFMSLDGCPLILLHGLELTALDSRSKNQKDLNLEASQNLFYEMDWVAAPNLENEKTPVQGTWLSFVNDDVHSQKIVQALRDRGAVVLEVKPGEAWKKEQGAYTVNPSSNQDFENLYLDIENNHKSLRGILFAWPLGSEVNLNTSSSIQDYSLLGFFHWTQVFLSHFKTAFPFYLLTQNTQGIENPDLQLFGSPLWGFTRVLALEHPEIFCKRIDLSHPALEMDALIRELSLESGEDQIVLRKQHRYVGRLKPALSLFESSHQKNSLCIPNSENYRLEINEAGTLESVEIRSTQFSALQNNEVRIETYSAGLNFSDILKVLGLYPGLSDGPIPVGIECSGKVLAVGPGVNRFKVGDEVLAVAPFSFASSVSTREEFVALKPDAMSFEEAATIPIAYLTAHYALNHLGRMRRGEKVLIHAGAGGVGVAAIALAKQAGLEIFATAGSPQKREFLIKLGVDHVLDSRDLHFADEILKITQGKGVDLVLNSLAGDFIPKSISVLGSYGRFLEIGKIDIYQNSKIGLLPFQNNLSYFAIDLDRVLREKPEWIRVFLDELMGYFNQGQLQALPHTDFTLEHSVAAFRYMAQRKNIGKVVVTLPHLKSKRPLSSNDGLFKSEGVYLITGGLGDIGLEIASFMQEKGARSFALLGRSAPSESALGQIEKIQNKGCKVEVYSCDVSNKLELQKVISEISQKQGALLGIIHAAGILDDAVILQQNNEKFEKVFAPKVLGAWNLHELSKNLNLDYFVMFSSVASVLGSPGQSNYASANAYLDALAHYRRSMGLTALSINWGPWAEIGMAARAEMHTSQSAKGLKPLAVKKALESFEKLLGHSEISQVSVLEVNWQDLQSLLPKQQKEFFLSGLIGQKTDFTFQQTSQSAAFEKNQIMTLSGNERKEALVQMIRSRVAKVLAIAADNLPLDQPLNTVGLDSLMAIEMKNDIETSLSLSLPMAFLLKGPSITQLAEYFNTQIENLPLAVKPALDISPSPPSIQ